MHRENESRILDGQRVEGLLQIGPDRGPSRIEIDLERTLVSQQVAGSDVMHGAIRRPEPAERRSEGLHNRLGGRDRDVPLIRAAAEEDDGRHRPSPAAKDWPRDVAVVW